MSDLSHSRSSQQLGKPQQQKIGDEVEQVHFTIPAAWFTNLGIKPDSRVIADVVREYILKQPAYADFKLAKAKILENGNGVVILNRTRWNLMVRDTYVLSMGLPETTPLPPAMLNPSSD